MGRCANEGAQLTRMPFKRLLDSRYRLERRLGRGGMCLQGHGYLLGTRRCHQGDTCRQLKQVKAGQAIWTTRHINVGTW